jgi:pimeloyl-ACP methyl ester carboxylesterase
VGNSVHSLRMRRRLRWLFVFFVLYLTVCVMGGIYLADGSLHPARRPLSDDEMAGAEHRFQTMHADLRDVSITSTDGVILSAWLLRPSSSNGDAVLVLHGLADNRLGMTGYAQLFLSHGYTVLLPDARAHGVSGGLLATYGLLEREDIHEWVGFLTAVAHPACIYGMGESMGAAELLESLKTESRFCAIAAESSFSTFREIAYDRMGQPFHLGPWVGRVLLRPLVEIAFLRARWKYGLATGQISPEEAVAQSRVPVLLIHGQIDSNIPVRHSRAIHARAPRSVLWEVPGADHCGALAAAPAEFERRVIGWFGRGTLSTVGIR